MNANPQIFSRIKYLPPRRDTFGTNNYYLRGCFSTDQFYIRKRNIETQRLRNCYSNMFYIVLQKLVSNRVMASLDRNDYVQVVP